MLVKVFKIARIRSVRSFSNKPPPIPKKDNSKYDDLIKKFVEKNSQPPSQPNQVEYDYGVNVEDEPDHKVDGQQKHNPRLKDKYSGIP
jgi:hypothetical protein